MAKSTSKVPFPQILPQLSGIFKSLITLNSLSYTVTALLLISSLLKAGVRESITGMLSMPRFKLCTVIESK